jgi:hypothetical protein
MASDHETRAPHPPLHPRLQSSRFKVRQSSPQSGRVILDDFERFVAKGESNGKAECINKALDAISQEVYLKKRQPLQETLCKSSASQPGSPHGNKNIDDNTSSPRRSPARHTLLHSVASSRNDDLLTSEETNAQCMFCAAAGQESKHRRDRSLVTTMNPVTGYELSPGGVLPMRDPVATCDRCNGGVCEFHLMLHSVKMPGHWESLTFYDSVVDSAYRSLPSHAQLLSRVMLRCACGSMLVLTHSDFHLAALTRSVRGRLNEKHKSWVPATPITRTEMYTSVTQIGRGRIMRVLRYRHF